jgi:hypothetical protein
MFVEFSELLKRIPENAHVLDLGGWNHVFPRADVVADLLPYETRTKAELGYPERFTKDTWIIADFCAPTFWSTIKDKQFDFITIGHTLEDIRDPLYVCSQMIRCGKAGYIEAPSKFIECSKENTDSECAGFEHHRWIVEPMNTLDGLIFKAKLSWAHVGDYLGDERRAMRRDYFHVFDGYFWSGSFQYIEHFAKGLVLEKEDLQWFYANVVRENTKRRNLYDLTPNASSPQDGRCLWVTEYELPSEYEKRTGRKPTLYKQYEGQVDLPPDPTTAAVSRN